MNFIAISNEQINVNMEIDTRLFQETRAQHMPAYQVEHRYSMECPMERYRLDHEPFLVNNNHRSVIIRETIVSKTTTERIVGCSYW
jgi:hypothetical protein